MGQERILTTASYIRGYEVLRPPLERFHEMVLGKTNIIVRFGAGDHDMPLDRVLLDHFSLDHVEVEFGEMVKPTSSSLITQSPSGVPDWLC